MVSVGVGGEQGPLPHHSLHPERRVQLDQVGALAGRETAADGDAEEGQWVPARSRDGGRQ